jgi:hypothetical protein
MAQQEESMTRLLQHPILEGQRIRIHNAIAAKIAH